MENKNLLRKIALSFHLSTGLDFDDLYQEASLAYLTAMRTYDPDKGRITTYLWYCVHNRLNDYLRLQKECKASYLEEEPEEIVYEHQPFWERISKDAQKIASLVLSFPNDYLNLSPENSVSKIRRILLRQGWKKERIENTFLELKANFS